MADKTENTKKPIKYDVGKISFDVFIRPKNDDVLEAKAYPSGIILANEDLFKKDKEYVDFILLHEYYHLKTPQFNILYRIAPIATSLGWIMFVVLGLAFGLLQGVWLIGLIPLIIGMCVSFYLEYYADINAMKHISVEKYKTINEGQRLTLCKGFPKNVIYILTHPSIFVMPWICRNMK